MQGVSMQNENDKPRQSLYDDSTVQPSTPTSPSSASLTSPIVTVATDKSGQFTAIGDAISYAQHNDIPTVTVLPGTYPAATVSATPSVAVIGQPQDIDGYSKNKVVISDAGTALTITADIDGITFQNINFINTDSDGAAVQVKGNKIAFYGCEFISAGPVGIETGLGIILIANSYIEAHEKAIDGKATLYVFKTSISPLDSSATVVNNLGTSLDDTLYNSTIVLDRSTISPKSGNDNDDVYLAKAKGVGSVAIYLSSVLDGFIAATGVHIDARTQSGSNFYGEHGDTGAGAYPNNKDARSPYVTLLDAADLAQFTIEAVFGNAYPDYATSDTSWIDSGSGSSSTGSTSPDASPAGTFVVSTNPSDGEYSSVSSAIKALPDDGKPYVIEIRSGTYKEQIAINRQGKVTIRGDTTYKNDFTKNLVTIETSDGVATKTGNDELTAVIQVKDSDGKTIVALYNINFHNAYPQKGDTVALAGAFDGLVAAYGCSFIGYHHTLFANEGTQVFSNSYIEGSIDFIWGSSTAYFHQSYIASNTNGYSITAQTRSSKNAAGGFVIDTSVVTYISPYDISGKGTYLGRPASEYSLVIYMNSFLDKHIDPIGWSSSGPSGTGHVTFGEYQNSGPGQWSDARASFAKKLSQSEAQAYTLSAWIGDISWIDMTAYDYDPSYSLTDGNGGSSPTAPDSGTGTSAPSGSGSGTSPSSPTGTGTAGHPKSGTKPPPGSVLVSTSGSIESSYSSVAKALKSLPDDGSLQTIFIYPGSYHEQVPLIDRNGPIIIIGYTSGAVGEGFSDNEVTITFSRGAPVSSRSSTHSDSDTATLSTASINIAVYNIDITNSDNLDGSKASYIAVAASVYGTQNAFYGCSFIGWEETLLTGGANSYQYYESSYIEGALDFIYGPAKSYFKGCTIGVKSPGNAITAQGRASQTAIGGYVFDQCLFGAASNAAQDLNESVFLGRPQSEYALVVVKKSHLTGVINPSGWRPWSSTDPRTDHITFAEYKNTGKGNWENNADAREASGLAKLLESDTYDLADVMESTDWIDMTYWDKIVTPEAEPGSEPSPETSPGEPSGDSDSDGTTPPDGAFIVSKNKINNQKTYKTIQNALDALSSSASSKTTMKVFIYPGTYHETLEITTPGTLVLIGYSDSPASNDKNQVTITSNKAVDTGSDEFPSDGATVYAAGDALQAMNIDFTNTNKAVGDRASIALAVKDSTYASLYGCQVSGGHNTLVIDGYLFAAESNIEGNTDMITGSGSGYFLDSKVSPNDDGISLTANKRDSTSSPGGFVFDQCTVTPSDGAGSMSAISLGRPLNPNARVAYIDSHLGSCIESAGWEEWSSDSARTSNVLFGEYNNDGPGSDTSERVPFATQLDDKSVAQFEISNFFKSTSWIDLTSVSATPFAPGESPASPTSSSSDPSSSGPEKTTTTMIVTDEATSLTTETPGDSPTTTGTTTTTVDAESMNQATATSTTVVTKSITDTEETSTTTSTETIVGDSTLSPMTVVKTKTEKGQTAAIKTITAADSIKTVEKTLTSTELVTASSSMTSTVFTTATSLKSSSPRTTEVTSTITFTAGTGGTTTVSAGTQVITSSITSTKTKTTSTTTTLSCLQATRVKRSLLPPRAVLATTVTDYSTTTEFLTTSTVMASRSKKSLVKTITVTRTADKKNAAKAATLVSTKTSSLTIPAVVTTTVTKSFPADSDMTPDPVTSTYTVTSTSTITTTVSAAAKTTTSLTTTTVKSLVGPTALVKVVTVTVPATSTIALPTFTSTKIVTTTYHNSPTVTVTTRPTSTKTKTVKTTSTVTNTVTATAKGATSCAS
ncbi:pectin lyase-like protein [Penicillium angulare]|uniref:pectinesterase n=1 Tax=Penicillium angulare TaxID=116970 RepID=A0A9W9G6A4_9EURO|nr:pectin lyase-like protein [Penicillium angulare]